MSSEAILLGIAAILVLGVSAQWLAWRLGLPSILLLLLYGIVAGPWLGLIRPDEMFGRLLTPLVSLAVALILYEGGLTLKLSEFRKVGTVVRNLVTVGAIVTLVLATISARYIIGLDWRLSLLFGAIMVVTGPTVIGPLLRHIRPTGRVGPILKWEGIVIDPIGAMLAVLIFESIQVGSAAQMGMIAVRGVVQTAAFGSLIGIAAAGILILVLTRYWIADHLQNPASLMLVVSAFTLSNLLQHESGLLAATVMGFVLANQRWADVRKIAEFKETLQVLLVACLFVVLAARLSFEEIIAVGPQGLAVVLVLILVIRPLSVFASTVGSPLSIRERLFLSWMAPRGIVAAAVSSVFALRLAPRYPEAAQLVPLTFTVIIATVAVYGITSPIAARRLGVAEANPQGVLFIGAHGWARDVAAALSRAGIRVTMVDSNRDNVNAARMMSLTTCAGNILDDRTLEEIDLGGLGRLAAVTPNDWVNLLAVNRFEHIFGRAQCYMLAPEKNALKERAGRGPAHAHYLFGKEATYEAIQLRVFDRFTVKTTKLSDEFDYAGWRRQYGDSALIMFVVDARHRLLVPTDRKQHEPRPGETIVAFVKERPARQAPAPVQAGQSA